MLPPAAAAAAVAAAAPAPAALYSGCAFNDAAAMAGTVTRLEAELAHAKAALADSQASQEGLHRQKRALEADVARLQAEVPFCHFGAPKHMSTHPVMQFHILVVCMWLQTFFHVACDADHLSY